MTQVRKLKAIPRPDNVQRAGFYPQGDLRTKDDVLNFIKGYVERMRSLERNPNIPRAQCRVAGQNAGMALRLLNAVRQRPEKDLLENPVDVLGEIAAMKAREAQEAGLPVESADLEEQDADED